MARGDSLTGVRDEQGALVLYKNGKLVGREADAELSKAFFGIWLGEKTTDVRQRRELLGGAG